MSVLSSADVVTFARAWHQRTPAPVIHDPYARVLCGPLLGVALRVRPLEWFVETAVLGRIMPASMNVVVRARHAERALENAVAAGVDQYVIIGAGMDSFAFRRADLAHQIEVFEIDHPATQRKKLDRVRRAGLAVTRRHHFIGADLSRTSTIEALAETPFDQSRRSFLSMLGVAYYLEPDDLIDTARSVALCLPEGTLMVIDYLLDETSSDPRDRKIRKDLLAFVEKRGEPMRSEYSIEEMDGLMMAQGFETIENLSMSELEHDYRHEFGSLPFKIPGIFGLGTYRVAAGAS